MLVLSRKLGEEIWIDGGITVRVLEIRGNKVRLGIGAPEGTGILRRELAEAEINAKSGEAKARTGGEQPPGSDEYPTYDPDLAVQ